MEIEKTYLIKEGTNLRDILGTPIDRKIIIQNYFMEGNNTRIRKVIKQNFYGSDVGFTMTIKSNDKTNQSNLKVRDELEFDISQETYEELLSNIPLKGENGRILKDRTVYNIDWKHKLEVDHYMDIDLIYAEIEFESEEDYKNFKCPSFLEETDSYKYGAKYIAFHKEEYK